MCGHVSPPGSAFCLNCGTQLAAAPAQTPAGAGGLPARCGTCGQENPAGMKFCRNCGGALAAFPPPTYPGPGPAGPIAAPYAGAAAGPPHAGPVIGGSPPQTTGQVFGRFGSLACPRCGGSTPAGFAFCQQCGFQLPNVDPSGPTMATPRPAAPVAPAPAPQPGWGAAVSVNRDGSDGERFPLTSEFVTVGRVGADLTFEQDRFLARVHARIERAGDGTARVVPLDTLNGVYKKLDAGIELADGAIFLVGREVLRFEVLDGDERNAAPLVRHGVALFGSPPREPWGRLIQLLPSGGVRDVRHLAGGEVVLGREEGDLIYRDDAFMSRRHAALAWDGRRATLRDLGSSNGSFIRLTGPTLVRHHDQVRMGDQLFRLELGR
ncbi:MAG: zinc ribbon domain-containing protein [Kofleriaceae bacterium]|nr:zinc ribbon domain-containing protein [Kofleriaceae bacterium]MBP6835963.1 zinc ribbon domain-containing protein [Kofleriaceae bacterium]MBP9208208.1 zinc ribbon domain-containing protein [Kofleriaceae bacterium]